MPHSQPHSSGSCVRRSLLHRDPCAGDRQRWPCALSRAGPVRRGARLGHRARPAEPQGPDRGRPPGDPGRGAADGTWPAQAELTLRAHLRHRVLDRPPGVGAGRGDRPPGRTARAAGDGRLGRGAAGVPHRAVHRSARTADNQDDGRPGRGDLPAGDQADHLRATERAEADEGPAGPVRAGCLDQPGPAGLPDGGHRVLPSQGRHQDDHRGGAAGGDRRDHSADHRHIVGGGHERDRQRADAVDPARYPAGFYGHGVDLAAALG